METLKNIGRPPFANYDLVVYFGGGLFALPFLYRYFLHPFGVPLPSFVLTESPQITLEIIRGLGPVDKLDSQSLRDVIQDSFCGGYLG
ncbi:hypothetical protein, partial [Qipengyuania huizhouensis]|uniref:hypothetical protein n=1 Tax=Qipengyuania huizhouensis TaxID=2867245 RepID=UPI001C8697C2